MKKRSGVFIFKDHTKLIEMLGLRRIGWTFMSLSELYNCDRTSLRYQCRKYKVFPQKTIFIKNSNEVFDPRRILSNVIVEFFPKESSRWIIIDGERINAGKSYKEYLKKGDGDLFKTPLSPYK